MKGRRGGMVPRGVYGEGWSWRIFIVNTRGFLFFFFFFCLPFDLGQIIDLCDKGHCLA